MGFSKKKDVNNTKETYYLFENVKNMKQTNSVSFEVMRRVNVNIIIFRSPMKRV